MAIQFQSNLASLSAQRVMFQNIRAQSDVLQQLSTGLRINSADDDAAGLAISERLNSQIRGNKKASENIQDAYNMLSTVDGFLGQVGDILQRQKELAVQARSDTIGLDQAVALQREFNNNADEIERMAENFQYNGLAFYQFDTSGVDKPFKVMAGYDGDINSFLDISDVLDLTDAGYFRKGLANYIKSGDEMTGFTTYGKGLKNYIPQYINISNFYASQMSTAFNSLPFVTGGGFDALEGVDNAILLVSGLRGRVGAHLNRFESALSNLNVQIENQTAAMARYTNTDFAKASIDLTRTQILQQSATSVLAQANQNQNIALLLIQN